MRVRAVGAAGEGGGGQQDWLTESGQRTDEHKDNSDLL